MGSRFTNSDDKLSRAASVVWRRNHEAAEVAADLEAFHAPSECYGDAYNDWDDETYRQMEECGITPETFDDIFCERTSAFTQHRLGLVV